MIRAIILDMGGVIIDLDRERCIKSFHALGCDAIDEMLDPFHQKGYFEDLEIGQIDADEFCEKIAGCCNPGVTHRQIREAFLSFCSGVEPYKWELIKKLGEKYEMYVLSNNNPIVVPYFNEIGSRYGVSLETSFKKCFFSYRMHMEKPCRDIFVKAISEIGLPAGEMLFVDDSAVNLEVGASFGLKTALCFPGDDLEKVIMQAITEYQNQK